jgi:hypothetical protein
MARLSGVRLADDLLRRDGGKQGGMYANNDTPHRHQATIKRLSTGARVDP